MRTIRGLFWIPAALILSAIAVVASWLMFLRRSRASRAHLTMDELPPANPNPSEPRLPVEQTAPTAADKTDDPPPPIDLPPINQRLSLIAWFVSLAFILLLASLVLRVMGSGQMQKPAEWLMFASLVTICAMIGALLMARHRPLAWPRWTWRFSGLAAAGLLSLTAAHLSYNSADPAETMYLATPLWIGAVALALGAAWSRPKVRIPEVPLATRWEIILLIGLTLLALLLRLINLREIPFALYGDETVFAVEARSFNQLLLFRPFVTAMHGHWGLFYMILGMFMRVFGETVEGIRLHSVLFGTMTIVTTYALTRLLWGRRTAIIAAALLATYHYHIHFSRSALQNAYDALFLTLIFGLFWLGWSTMRRRPWVLGALALGLAQSFYVGGRTILLLLAVMGLFWLITDRARVKAQALNIALAIGVFAVVVIPIFYFAYLRPDDYMTRYNQMLIFRNGWLEAAMQAQHTGALAILWQQLVAALKLFVLGTDGLFYRGQSLLTPIMSLLAIGGLVYLLRHIKEGRAFMLLSSLGLIILTAGVFTLGPGTSGHHYVATAPFIYMAIAVFIDWGLRLLHKRGLPLRRVTILGTALVLVLMLLDSYAYFGEFVPRHELASTDVEPAMQLGAYLHTLEQQPVPPAGVLCIHQPNISCQHTTVQFLAPQLSAVARDLMQPATPGDLNLPSAARQIVIVAGNLPDDLALVEATFPDVIPQPHFGINGNLLFTAFEIPASQP